MSAKWIFKNGKYRCTNCGSKAVYRYINIEAVAQPKLTSRCPSCGSEMEIALMQREYLTENDK